MTEMICYGIKMQFFPEENGQESHTIVNDRIYISNSRFEILPPKIKEENTMKVSYKGVTGELVRLERSDVVSYSTNSGAKVFKWELDVWDNENGFKVSFPSVSIKDVKFLGGEVTYG